MMLASGGIALLLLCIMIVAEGRLYQHVLLSDQRIEYSHQALLLAWQALLEDPLPAEANQPDTLAMKGFRIEHRYLPRTKNCQLHQVEVTGPAGSHAELQLLNCMAENDRRGKNG